MRLAAWPALLMTAFAGADLRPQEPSAAEPWWSLAPLEAVDLPAVAPAKAGWVREPLDAFVLAELTRQGLTPSEEADRRTLLRRLCIDLTGLLPTPEEVRAFVADPRPDAYEREVERLLASPRYGERWARHWLDVVHYADTHGYDKDKPRRNAWPYRDWVIEAFNGDMPWARFVEAQVAGDALPDSDAVVATGMLVAGPWDFVGHVELREGTTDKKKVRNLDRDDVVTNVFSSFQSLTVHCARCHDHKFDPVSQAEYYDLQAVFAGIERADRRYDADAEVARERAALTARAARLEAELAAMDAELDRRMAEDLVPELVALCAERAALPAVPLPDRSRALGWHSQIAARPDVEKWVEVDLGRTLAIDEVVVYPCNEVFAGHPGPGFGLPSHVEVQVAAEGEEFTRLGSWEAAGEGSRHGDRPLRFSPAADTRARRVRVRSTALFERSDDYCFAVAELEVMSGGENVARGTAVRALDTIEAGERWGARFLVDGERPWSVAAAQRDDFERRWHVARAALETTAERTVRRATRDALERTKTGLLRLPPQETVYAAAVEFPAQGAFTPPPGGAPRPVHLLHRGDVDQPREESWPGAVAAPGHLPQRFALPPDHGGADRRLALARWLTHRDNPLTWRSIVNRVWHFHFGRGIAATPNDFGKMGARPTHPALLDFLAVQFRDGGGSLKDLHRMILRSATYRQVSAQRADAAEVDAANRFLWRANRRRLEAEALRDAVLQVSGNLDLTMGGPGFELFAFEDDHSPRYRYETYDVDDPRAFRRSVYRFVVRSVPDPWMTVFDCADPSVCTAARMETTTALQALGLLNDTFMLRQAARLAERLRHEGGDPIERAVWLVWQRGPTADEARALRSHADAHGLAAVCRVLLNTSEFLHVD